MAQSRIVILDDYQQVALNSAGWSPLLDRCEITTISEHIADPAELVERLAGFDIVVAMRERTALPAAVLEQLSDLRLLVTTGMANAAIDVPAAVGRGITVCGTGGGSASTPEMCWALLLAVTRNLVQEDRHVREGGWQQGIGRELANSTLGLMGLGRIGAQIALYGKAFGMNLIAWSQNLTAEQAAAHGARLVSKAELFAEADVVSIHLKLSERTIGLVGAAELALLGPEGYLVNTSRGPIVDETALVAALSDRTIAGAALDVFDQEPLPKAHPLRTLPNTVLSPHMAYVTTAGYEIFYGEAIEDILGWLDGNPVRILT